MFELSKRSLFAVNVLVELAREPEVPRSTEELASTLGVSANHLAKVMQTLSRAGWIEGSRGPSGGYQFCGDETSISMADVVQLFEGPVKFQPRAEGATRTPEAATIASVLREIEEQAYYTLSSVTIHLLAHPPGTSR